MAAIEILVTLLPLAALIVVGVLAIALDEVRRG